MVPALAANESNLSPCCTSYWAFKKVTLQTVTESCISLWNTQMLQTFFFTLWTLCSQTERRVSWRLPQWESDGVFLYFSDSWHQQGASREDWLFSLLTWRERGKKPIVAPDPRPPLEAVCPLHFLCLFLLPLQFNLMFQSINRWISASFTLLFFQAHPEKLILNRGF